MNKYEYNIYEQISRNIKKYRKEAGMTQAVLSEKVGLSHEFIRRIESKKGVKTFSVDTVWKISVALNYFLSFLLEYLSSLILELLERYLLVFLVVN